MTDHTPGDNDTPPASSASGSSGSFQWGDTAPMHVPIAPHPYEAYPPAYGYGPPPPRRNNGLAVTALVVACVAVAGMCASGVGGLLGVVGAVLGHVARRQIRQTGEGGAGLALAAVIVGWACTGVAAATIVGLAWLLTTGSFGP